MEAKGNATYWGQDFAEDTPEDTKTLLGYEPTLTMEARDGDETEARRQAQQILQDHDMQGLNARQLVNTMRSLGGLIVILCQVSVRSAHHTNRTLLLMAPSSILPTRPGDLLAWESGGHNVMSPRCH